MKHTSLLILAFGAMTFLPACKKSGGGGGATNNADAYYPATLSFYEGNNGAYPAKSTFKYDDKHHLTYFGSKDRWTDIAASGATLVVPGGYDTTILVNIFNGNIYTGAVTEVRQNYANKSGGSLTTYPVSTYSFTGMDKTAGVTSTYNGGKYTQYFTLDGNGNLTDSKFVTNAWGSPNSTAFDPGGLEYVRMKFTGYDTKPSPYSALPEWKFASFPWSYPEQMSFGFSKHNPTQIIEENLNTTTMKWAVYRQVDFTYTYNDQGYPSEVKITTLYPQSPAGQNTFYATYDFTYSK